MEEEKNMLFLRVPGGCLLPGHNVQIVCRCLKDFFLPSFPFQSLIYNPDQPISFILTVIFQEILPP